MPQLFLAAAQSVPKKGDVESNIREHLRLIVLAAEKGAGLVHFPELSLTGYEPELAKELAFEKGDSRINPLKEIAEKKHIVVVAGAPFSVDGQNQIASFVLHPDGTEEVYTKHFLHNGEEKYFLPGAKNPQLCLEEINASLAICADISHSEHFEAAMKSGSSVYLPGVFITSRGYAADAEILSQGAKEFKMLVLMANFGGPSGNYYSAGKSACWDSSGEMLAQLPDKGSGLLLAKFKQNAWSAETYNL